MALTSYFNLQAKGQTQLKGLYIDLFNRIDCQNIEQCEHDRLEAALKATICKISELDH